MSEVQPTEAEQKQPEASRGLRVEQKVIDEGRQERLKKFKGTIGEVYLPLKWKLEELGAQRNRFPPGEEPKALLHELDKVSSLVSMLEMTLDILPAQIEKGQQIGIGSVVDTRLKETYKAMIEDEVLRGITLDEAMVKLGEIVRETAQDYSSTGRRNKEAANTLKTKVMAATQASRT